LSGRAGYEIDGLRVAQARQALRPDGEKRQRDDDATMTQGDLADLIGVHRVTLNKIEAGQRAVSLDTLERLAVRLGRSREWLLGEPETIDEFELAREKMANALSEFSSAVDLLQRAARDAAGLQAALRPTP
jgi:transcriptional regulator with XRE-family HTH domain